MTRRRLPRPPAGTHISVHTPDRAATPEQGTPAVLPGDFFLTHQSGIITSLIRAAQTIRYRGADARYAWWDHAGGFVDGTGNIVEAMPSGVRLASISEYADREYTVVHLGDLPMVDRAEMLSYYLSQLGMRYGWARIVNIAVRLLLPGQLTWSGRGVICSGLVACALERAGWIWPVDPGRIMPADLARSVDVHAGHVARALQAGTTKEPPS